MQGDHVAGDAGNADDAVQDDSQGKKKFKETPVPAVAEPVAPLRNVGALVPGAPSASILLFFQGQALSFSLMDQLNRAYSWGKL